MLKTTRRKIRTKARNKNPMAAAPARVQPTPMQMAMPRPSMEEWEQQRAEAIAQVKAHERDLKYQRIGEAIGFALRGIILLAIMPFYLVFHAFKFVAMNGASLMYAAVGIFALTFIFITIKVMWEAGLLW